MKELKNFYGLIEILFFLGGFCIFLIGIFLKNNFHFDVSFSMLKIIILPYIFIAILYGIFSIFFSFSGTMQNEEEEEDGIFLTSIFLIGMCLYIFILYIFFAFPSQI